jgi:hypothetical protein
MKTVIVSFCALALILISCNSASDGLKQKTEDMCTAMELYNPEDAGTMLEAADAMAQIKLNDEKYGEVSNQELLNQMMIECPEGAEKFKQLNPDF